MRISASIIGLLAGALLCGAAQAEGWTAGKLRGSDFVAQGAQWVPLKRGDVVAEGAAVRTAANGYVEFDRGDETITLAANTEVQIRDQQGARFTTVTQSFGTVTVSDDHTAVPHFEVDTDHIAAVVKGTVFTVTSDPRRSRVDVRKGEVQVSDRLRHISVLLFANQHASAGIGMPLSAGGSGAVAPVVNKLGQAVTTQTGTAAASSSTSASSDSGSSDDSSSDDSSSSTKTDNGKGNGKNKD